MRHVKSITNASLHHFEKIELVEIFTKLDVEENDGGFCESNLPKFK
jgi:hypothetical protein